MDVQEFKQLIERSESDTIDFKQELYDFNGFDADEKKRKRAKFAKDILCMSNTPREQDAYIIIGGIKHRDGRWEAKGLSTQIDGYELQHQIEGWIYPHPKFHYDPIIYEGLQYGVITIPSDRTIGPYFAVQEDGNTLKKHQLYHRRDSVNSEADAYWQGRIFEWFNEKAPRHGLLENDDTPQWGEFVDAVDNFNSLRQYILVVPNIEKKDQVNIENLGLIPWSFVIDFDPDSEIDGALFKCRENLEGHRVLHRVVRGDKPNLNLNKGTYWYFAMGMAGRNDSLFAGKFRDWQTQYDKDLRYQLETISVESGAKPTTVVMIVEDSDLANHYYSIAGAINSAFGNSAEFILISSNQSAYQKMIDDFDAKIFNFPLHHLCYGLDALKRDFSETDAVKIVFPSSTNTPITISEKDFLWLSEELELVHINLGLKPSNEFEPGWDFLRGRMNEISWYELGLQVDVSRDITKHFLKDVRSALSRRRTRRLNFYHMPGAGGTTVARRLLWDLRTEYPSFVLRKTKPTETADRLAFVYSITQLPILLTLDGSEITDRQSDELYEVLAARQIPVVMLQVLRRFSMQVQNDNCLDTILSEGEVGRLVHQLGLYVPDRKDELEHVSSFSRSNYKTLFFLGLVAFERDFVSLERYVKTRLEGLTDTQFQIMQFLAFAYFYGQQPISAQAFATLLGIPLSRIVDIENNLPQPTLELILQMPGGKWRVTHQLVAQEILLQSLTKGNIDKRNWWQKLPDLAIKFISFCRGVLPEPTNEGLELARRIFVFRDNSELLGTEQGGERGGNPLFAQLISDIKLAESKLRVLEVLTNNFPDEPHFWAHLGRLYALELKQFEKAINAIEQGIRLLPNDHVLYHMKGMASRSSVYWDIEQRKDFNDVLLGAKDASEAFKKARELDPVDEHGYISEAQMIMRVLDYLSKAKNQPAVVAAANSDDAWLREAFQLAEDLLEQVRRIRVGERSSEYELRCRADLDLLYGRHQIALQTWDNLLSRSKAKESLRIYAPPIRRQIVWTHLSLSSKDRNWRHLSKSNLERCVSLLEENLSEEPNDDRNLRLWIQAARFQQTPPSMESAIEKIAHWRLQANTIDSIFYLYVLYAVQSINGFPLARDNAERALEECRRMSKYRRDRTRSFEWLGNDAGLRQLVHQSTLGEWSPIDNFWKSANTLKREIGVVVSVQGPEAGWIEVRGGLRAFFVPGVGSSKRLNTKSSFPAGLSENKPISFYLGFSYDGLRAWSVIDPDNPDSVDD